jgi:type III secretory pathway component EscU
MLSAIYKPLTLSVNKVSVIMLNVIMLNVNMLNGIMLNGIMLNGIMLNGIMLNVIMLSLVAPKIYPGFYTKIISHKIDKKIGLLKKQGPAIQNFFRL